MQLKATFDNSLINNAHKTSNPEGHLNRVLNDALRKLCDKLYGTIKELWENHSMMRQGL